MNSVWEGVGHGRLDMPEWLRVQMMLRGPGRGRGASGVRHQEYSGIFTCEAMRFGPCQENIYSGAVSVSPWLRFRYAALSEL